MKSRDNCHPVRRMHRQTYRKKCTPHIPAKRNTHMTFLLMRARGPWRNVAYPGTEPVAWRNRNHSQVPYVQQLPPCSPQRILRSPPCHPVTCLRASRYIRQGSIRFLLLRKFPVIPLLRHLQQDHTETGPVRGQEINGEYTGRDEPVEVSPSAGYDAEEAPMPGGTPDSADQPRAPHVSGSMTGKVPGPDSCIIRMKRPWEKEH